MARRWSSITPASPAASVLIAVAVIGLTTCSGPTGSTRLLVSAQVVSVAYGGVRESTRSTLHGGSVTIREDEVTAVIRLQVGNTSDHPVALVRPLVGVAHH